MCEEAGCDLDVENMVQLIGHLLQVHMRDYVCVLCPEDQQYHKYPSKLHVVQHLERHLTKTTYAYRRPNYECPYCFKLQLDRAAWEKHVLNVHLKDNQVAGFASKAGILSEEERDLNNNVLAAAQHTSGVLRGMRLLPVELRSINAQSTNGKRPFEAISQLMDSTEPMNDWEKEHRFRSYTLFSEPPKRGPRTFVHKAKPQDLPFNSEGELLCPINCCDRTFTENLPAAHHVIEEHGRACPWCPEGEDFSDLSVSAYNKHIARHIPPMYACKYCRVKYETNGERNKHERAHELGTLPKNPTKKKRD